jgi:hypothetical protein
MGQKSLKIPSLILVFVIVVVSLAHFKQVGPEMQGGSFGTFPDACRLYCTRNCALVMHSQNACPEGVYLENQITYGSEIQAHFKAFKNGILQKHFIMSTSLVVADGSGLHSFANLLFLERFEELNGNYALFLPSVNGQLSAEPGLGLAKSSSCFLHIWE